jgi:serine/threonine protein kinase
MPLYSGSLRTLLQPGIDPGDVIRYFAQLLDGVECAHLKNVVHRDLKPENVLYDQTTDRLVLADFGIAHFSEDELFTAILTKDNERLANHRYAAPEQETRGLTVDKRADIFALGLILNEMFTGEIPKGSGYKTIEGVSSEYMYLDAIVDHMIRQSPGERPSDIEDVKRILRVREDEFITSQRVSSLSQVVVPVSQLDDSLISDPIQLVDKDWDRGRLNLILNQAPNEKWVWHFKNQGNYSSLGDYPPEIFDFRKNNAIVNCPDTKVQQVIDYFKPWLSTANDLYKKGLNETFD